ncbi:hypothetical protein ACFFX0_03870 [Citricoccus parietis]|uniref:Uncharacterized protein n=1 Tax=Citricoccus parietis TaxID=592307 RepID=A0ABV5FUK2_9MICC
MSRRICGTSAGTAGRTVPGTVPGMVALTRRVSFSQRSGHAVEFTGSVQRLSSPVQLTRSSRALGHPRTPRAPRGARHRPRRPGRRGR